MLRDITRAPIMGTVQEMVGPTGPTDMDQDLRVHRIGSQSCRDNLTIPNNNKQDTTIQTWTDKTSNYGPPDANRHRSDGQYRDNMDRQDQNYGPPDANRQRSDGQYRDNMDRQDQNYGPPDANRQRSDGQYRDEHGQAGPKLWST